VKLVAYGDMGYFDSGQNVTKMILEKEMGTFDFVMHVGLVFLFSFPFPSNPFLSSQFPSFFSVSVSVSLSKNLSVISLMLMVLILTGMII